MFYSHYPQLDLHGMDRVIAILKVKEFLEDARKLGYSTVIIIHGIGTGVLREAVSTYLKKNKTVADYRIDFMNPGCTIVRLKETLTK